MFQIQIQKDQNFMQHIPYSTVRRTAGEIKENMKENR